MEITAFSKLSLVGGANSQWRATSRAIDLLNQQFVWGKLNVIAISGDAVYVRWEYSNDGQNWHPDEEQDYNAPGVYPLIPGGVSAVRWARLRVEMQAEGESVLVSATCVTCPAP